jgi:hypothetical protein
MTRTYLVRSEQFRVHCPTWGQACRMSDILYTKFRQNSVEISVDDPYNNYGWLSCAPEELQREIRKSR